MQSRPTTQARPTSGMHTTAVEPLKASGRECFGSLYSGSMSGTVRKGIKILNVVPCDCVEQV